MRNNLDKRRWLILVAACLINLCIGSLYAWSIFAMPMANYLSEVTGKEIVSLSIVFTVANGVGPITMIAGGAITKKIGPKMVVILGGILFACGMIGSGFVKSVGLLVTTYGVLVGLGVGMVYGCTISNTIRFFPDKRGLIGGIATASYGISSVLVPFAANMLIDRVGVTASFKIIGIAMLIVIVIASAFIEKCPDGYAPAGYVGTAGGTKQIREFSWSEMLKEPLFYLMLLVLCCCATSGMMIISQASPLAQRVLNITAGTAASIVSTIALFNTIGRIIAGGISDKLGPVVTIRCIFAGSIIGLALMYVAVSGGAGICFYLGAYITALMFGSIMGIYPGFTASQFGPKNNGVNFGIMFIGFALAGLIGPTILSRLYVSTGNDSTALLLAMGLSAAGLLAAFVLSKFKKN